MCFIICDVTGILKTGVQSRGCDRKFGPGPARKFQPSGGLIDPWVKVDGCCVEIESVRDVRPPTKRNRRAPCFENQSKRLLIAKRGAPFAASLALDIQRKWQRRVQNKKKEEKRMKTTVPDRRGGQVNWRPETNGRESVSNEDNWITTSSSMQGAPWTRENLSILFFFPPYPQ